MHPQHLGSVLVVEDHPGMRGLIANWVAMSGYQAVPADCADTALKCLAGGRPDFAICDIGLPGRDGLWLAGQLRYRFPTLPVILTTGRRDTEVDEALRTQKADDVLLKPFDLDRLQFVLDRASRRTLPTADRRRHRRLAPPRGRRRSRAFGPAAT